MMDQIPVRSETNLQKLKSLWSKPIVIDDFITPQEAAWIRSELKNGEHEVVQGLGDFKLELTFLTETPSVIEFFAKKLKPYNLKPVIFREINHFIIERPYNVHSDGGRDAEEIPYKNLVVWLDAGTDAGGLVLFKQYTHFSWSLTNSYAENYNFIMDGAQKEFIENYNPQAKIDQEQRSQFLAHVPDKDLKGLEIECCVPYQQWRAVLFDSCQLHTTASQIGKDTWKEGLMVSLCLQSEAHDTN